MSNQSSNDYSSEDNKSADGCSVFVSNLPFEMNWRDLKDLARQTVGDVAHVDMFKTSDRRSRGIAVVKFNTPEDANKAVEALNGYEVEGRQLAARIDTKPPRSAPTRNESSSGSSGSRYSAPRSSGSRSGPGASSSSSSSSSSPTDTADSSESSGRTPAEPDSAIFIGNLPWSVTWFDLKDLCRPFGTVLYANVVTTLMNGQRRSKGFGIVRFQSASDAAAAIAGLNGTEMRGRPLLVRLDSVNRRQRGDDAQEGQDSQEQQ